MASTSVTFWDFFFQNSHSFSGISCRTQFPCCLKILFLLTRRKQNLQSSMLLAQPALPSVFLVFFLWTWKHGYFFDSDSSPSSLKLLVLTSNPYAVYWLSNVLCLPNFPLSREVDTSLLEFSTVFSLFMSWIAWATTRDSPRFRFCWGTSAWKLDECAQSSFICDCAQSSALIPL